MLEKVKVAVDILAMVFYVLAPGLAYSAEEQSGSGSGASSGT